MDYFDYISTTKPSKSNIELYSKLLNDVYFHGEEDNSAGQLLEESKQLLLGSLNTTGSVVYTSGGTEANNLAILGFAKSFSSSKHFITTPYEHSSVSQAFKELERLGHQVTYLPIEANGQVDVNQLTKAITDQTVLVSIMAVNNELGSINDPLIIRQAITNSTYSPKLMMDCVQAVGKVSISYDLIDIITISGHKLYAPKGVGAVIFKDNVKINSIAFGGTQQDYYRPGTFSVPLATVLSVAVREQIKAIDTNNHIINQRISKFIQFVESTDKITINCPIQTSVVSVRLAISMQSESVVTHLKQLGIIVSSRSACSKKLNVPSPALSAIGLNIEQIDHSLRISFSSLTTEKEVNNLINQLKKLIETK